MIKIPFARPDIGEEEREALNRVLSSGWLTSGPEVEAFEKEFARSVKTSEAIALNSCTAALHLALLALKLGPGDAAIVPAITFIATAEAVLYTGARPLLLDVDAKSLLVTPGLLKEFIEKKCTTKEGKIIHKESKSQIKALLPVHIGGQPCDLQKLHGICNQYGIAMIDDAAHAFGSSIQKNPIGSNALPAKMSAFSFYATKNITTGEGGMLTLKDRELAKRIRQKRLHGIAGQSYGRARWHYDVVLQGYKYNLTDMAAAIGRVQLKRSPRMQNRRKTIYDYYKKEFSELSWLSVPPPIEKGFGNSFHLFIVQFKTENTRDTFVDYMHSQGIGVSLHFIPLYRHSLWKKRFLDLPRDFPNSEQAFASMVSLPIYSALSDAEIEIIADTVSTFLS